MESNGNLRRFFLRSILNRKRLFDRSTENYEQYFIKLVDSSLHTQELYKDISHFQSPANKIYCMLFAFYISNCKRLFHIRFDFFVMFGNLRCADEAMFAQQHTHITNFNLIYICIGKLLI